MRRTLVLIAGSVAALAPGVADPSCVVKQSVETFTLEVESVTLDGQAVTDALPTESFSIIATTATTGADSAIGVELYNPDDPQTPRTLSLEKQP